MQCNIGTAPKLIMFDMDGTLINSGAMIANTVATTFSAHNLPVPNQHQVNQIIGLTLENALSELSGRPLVACDELAETYRQNYRAAIAAGTAQEGLYPFARETIVRLAAEPTYLLGIATGKGLRGVHRVLAEYEMANYFVTLQTPDHNPSKPHPAMMLNASAQTGIAVENCVMIGDTTYDMDLAKAAGAKAIGVSWGYHSTEQLLSSDADRIVDSFEALELAIKEVFENA